MIENYQGGGGKVTEVNYDDVRADLRTVMTDSQEVKKSSVTNHITDFLVCV